MIKFAQALILCDGDCDAAVRIARVPWGCSSEGCPAYVPGMYTGRTYLSSGCTRTRAKKLAKRFLNNVSKEELLETLL